MIVAKITKKQAEQLKGVETQSGQNFNPIQDVKGNWLISLDELMHCDLAFASSVELINYEPIVLDIEKMIEK